MTRFLAALPLVVLLAACGNPKSATSGGAPAEEHEVEAPFTVREGAPGLVFVYRDAEGFHTVERIADVPAPARARVRVDSLSLPPERRLDPSLVYVVDLRTPRADGSYGVRTLARDRFEAEPERAASATAPSGGIVLYGASWCGACRAAKQYFESRGVAFVEKDIEREPGAREEMLAKARAAGIDGSGIPVIDVRGTVVTGFDAARLDALLGARRPRTL